MAAKKRKKGSSSRKKSSRKKTSHKKSGRKKSTGTRKRSGRKKSSRKRSRRKYARSSGSDVRKEMHEYKRGEARSGRSGRKVKSRKQAIAIGLSKARRKGKRVPPNPNRRKRS